MDKFHQQHLLYLAEEMLRDAREMEHSYLCQKATYEKVDTTGWRLELKMPSIRIYQDKGGEASFLIVVTSRKRNYLRHEDYRRRK